LIVPKQLSIGALMHLVYAKRSGSKRATWPGDRVVAPIILALSNWTAESDKDLGTFPEFKTPLDERLNHRHPLCPSTGLSM
jgi:hypothetical protein